jgi:hypothetical protein
MYKLPSPRTVLCKFAFVRVPPGPVPATPIAIAGERADDKLESAAVK